VDAAIAAMMALSVVEPQAAGLGGGGFLMHYNAGDKAILTYDGRESAPATADPSILLGVDGKQIAAEAAMGGAFVATPGLVRMLGVAHGAHGRLPWSRLFEPAMRLARDGAPITPRLHRALAAANELKDSPAGRKHFFDAAVEPRAAGERLVNNALAETFRAIANGGADAFYSGAIARDIAAAVKNDKRRGNLAASDLAEYHAVIRAPLCAPYRGLNVCSMSAPASGLVLVQTLGMLERFAPRVMGGNGADGAHAFAEVLRLVQADRQRYLADPEFTDVPLAGLIDRKYLESRAKLINPARMMAKAEAGRPANVTGPAPSVSSGRDLPGTGHVNVVDGAGNAVSLTASLGGAFGSRVFVRGFVLNNHLAEFAPPSGASPAPANAFAPGKRPRSTMTPAIVLDREQHLAYVMGGAGGARTPAFLARILINAQDGKKDLSRAMAHALLLFHNGTIEIEQGTTLAGLAPALREAGHQVEILSISAPLNAIAVLRSADGTQLLGTVDRRRDGAARGD
jgi:gamma-glutamyltranspeptidase/glutathione hydrolase